MWLKVLVMVESPDADRFQRKVLVTAMERRGCTPTAADGFCAILSHIDDDAAVVQRVEQDVKESAYIADIVDYQGACILQELKGDTVLDADAAGLVAVEPDLDPGTYPASVLPGGEAGNRLAVAASDTSLDLADSALALGRLR